MNGMQNHEALDCIKLFYLQNYSIKFRYRTLCIFDNKISMKSEKFIRRKTFLFQAIQLENKEWSVHKLDQGRHVIVGSLQKPFYFIILFICAIGTFTFSRPNIKQLRKLFLCQVTKYYVYDNVVCVDGYLTSTTRL